MLTDGDFIVAQAAQFFTAGFETSSSTLSFTIYELCLNPQIQDRLRNEIIETITSPQLFTYDNVMGMKYMHMVVSGKYNK